MQTKTDAYGRPLADPFVCAICERDIHADRWHPHQHMPPICRYCSIRGGHQSRIPGMTRGDHHTLQRLVAITNALKWEVPRGRFFSK